MYLLDTNVLSEPKRRQPDSQVLAWLEAADDEPTYISVLSLGEIEQGIAKLGTTKQAKEYRRWLEADLTPKFAGRILAVDDRVALAWGRFTGQLLRQGRPLAVVDALLAATALAHDLTLVTRNAKDFSGTKVKLHNPWKP